MSFIVISIANCQQNISHCQSAEVFCTNFQQMRTLVLTVLIHCLSYVSYICSFYLRTLVCLNY